jgi:hypothetical protein
MPQFIHDARWFRTICESCTELQIITVPAYRIFGNEFLACLAAKFVSLYIRLLENFNDLL